VEISVSDGQLVTRSIEGDTEAFAALVKRYQRAVYATAFYYVGRYGAAEDIAQEAFWAAYRSLPRLNDPERFAPWIREITCRTAANWLRRHGKRLDKETPLPMRRTISIEDARSGPSGQVESKERFEQIQKGIDSLPERYRLPVVLRYLQEQSYDEISAFTGESKDEVRGILQRAARQLRDLLSDMKSDEGEGRWHPVRK
jgi:RNA polymerase sigma-70 factor (ECF subfamily)